MPSSSHSAHSRCPSMCSTCTLPLSFYHPKHSQIYVSWMGFLSGLPPPDQSPSENIPPRSCRPFPEKPYPPLGFHCSCSFAFSPTVYFLWQCPFTGHSLHFGDAPQISPYCAEQKLQIILSIAAIESPLSFDSLLTVSMTSDTVAVSWLPVPIRSEPRNLLKWTSGFAPSIPTFRRYSQHKASPIFRSLYFDL